MNAEFLKDYSMETRLKFMSHFLVLDELEETCKACKLKTCNLILGFCRTEITREAILKQIPKKPAEAVKNEYICPNCGVSIELEYYNKLKYCGDCGQAIDWSDEK